MKNSMKDRSIGFALLSLSLALGGCFETVSSDQVKPEVIYQSYRVRYSEENRSLTAYAEFNVGGRGGTSVELKAPSQVTFDNKALSVSHFMGTSYELESWRTYSAEHSFIWVDPEGKSYHNTVSISPVSIMSYPQAVASSSIFNLRISGSDLKSDERYDVVLTQGNSSSGYVYSTGRVEVASAEELRISTDTPLRVGSLSLKLTRVRTTALQETTAQGGEITGIYEAIPVSITVY